MKILSIKDGLIPWVTATNLGPNFPLNEVELVVSVQTPGLTKLQNLATLQSSLSTTKIVVTIAPFDQF